MTKAAATPIVFPARIVAAGIIVHVRVTPKAAVDAVEGIEMRAGSPVLAVRVRALPDKGEANGAVVGVLAKWLSEPKGQLRVASGAKSRLKQVLVAGEPAALMAKLSARLAAME